MTAPDLDALCERLKDQYGDPKTGGFDYTNPDGPEAVAAIKALIAELKEAREALIAVKVSADHMPPMSSTRRIEWRIKSFNPAIALVRAFLARNGKGEV